MHERTLGKSSRKGACGRIVGAQVWRQAGERGGRPPGAGRRGLLRVSSGGCSWTHAGCGSVAVRGARQGSGGADWPGPGGVPSGGGEVAGCGERSQPPGLHRHPADAASGTATPSLPALSPRAGGAVGPASTLIPWGPHVPFSKVPTAQCPARSRLVVGAECSRSLPQRCLPKSTRSPAKPTRP